MKIYQTVYTVTSNQNNLKDKIDLYIHHQMLAIFRSYISFLSSGSVANVPLLAAGTHIRGLHLRLIQMKGKTNGWLRSGILIA